MPCQSNAVPCSAPDRIRNVIAKAAIFGAVPMRTVIDVGAPSYTSGTHM
jgi:hypothetical protein